MRLTSSLLLFAVSALLLGATWAILPLLGAVIVIAPFEFLHMLMVGPPKD